MIFLMGFLFCLPSDETDDFFADIELLNAGPNEDDGTICTVAQNLRVSDEEAAIILV